VLREEDGHRPWFIAHLVVEMQLDAVLAAESPGRIGAYYAALESLDPEEVERVVRDLVVACPPGVARLVRRFVAERFLDDYADPVKLVRRLDAVLRRTRQPGVPAELAAVLPASLEIVRSHAASLLV
jgi:hypothetical protein